MNQEQENVRRIDMDVELLKALSNSLPEIQSELSIASYSLSLINRRPITSVSNAFSENLRQILGQVCDMADSVHVMMGQVVNLLFPDNEQEKSLSDSSTQAASADAD